MVGPQTLINKNVFPGAFGHYQVFRAIHVFLHFCLPPSPSLLLPLPFPLPLLLPYPSPSPSPSPYPLPLLLPLPPTPYPLPLPPPQRLDRAWYDYDGGYDETNNPFSNIPEEYTKKREEQLAKNTVKRMSAHQRQINKVAGRFSLNKKDSNRFFMVI